MAQVFSGSTGRSVGMASSHERSWWRLLVRLSRAARPPLNVECAHGHANNLPGRHSSRCSDPRRTSRPTSWQQRRRRPPRGTPGARSAHQSGTARHTREHLPSPSRSRGPPDAVRETRFVRTIHSDYPSSSWCWKASPQAARAVSRCGMNSSKSTQTESAAATRSTRSRSDDRGMEEEGALTARTRSESVTGW